LSRIRSMDASHSSKLRRLSRDSDAAQTSRHSHANAAVAPAHEPLHDTETERDIMFVPNWFFCCEVLPELPSVRGWVEAMTSLGRLIFFDQPGTGVSDPVTARALPTLEQWADSITAVLDDLGSSEAVLVAFDGAFAPAALFAATYPSRTTALVVLDG